MNNSINISGNVTNSQIGHSLANCSNIIHQQLPGEFKMTLEQLSDEARQLAEELPVEKRDEVFANLELMVQGLTKRNRPWYSVSSDGLIEASKYVKDFSRNIAGTIRHLGQLVWPEL